MVEPNAFALPGGYIYVSRGLLAIANSEAELANVIGHEIGHVAARHAAQRQTQQAGAGLATLGAVLVGAVLGGGAGAELGGQVAQVAGAGLIASYGRDQERQSDEVGQTLTAESGWDPAGMPDFLSTLGRDSRLRADGQDRRPSFLDSHPMTEERVETTEARARALPFEPGTGAAGSRAAFLRRLEGMVVGEDPSEGLFREQRFLHPGLDFVLEFPPGWRTQNGHTAVAAQSPGQDALILLEVDGETGDPRAAATRFAQGAEISLEDGRRGRIGGFEAYRATATAQSEQGLMAIDLTWIAHPRFTFRLTGMTSPGRLGALQPDFGATSRSFRSLTRRERDSISVERLALVAARSGESLTALSARTGNAWSPARTAVSNDLPERATLHAGQLVKIALRFPYFPAD
jgi:predicted Zn-dependent protease